LIYDILLEDLFGVVVVPLVRGKGAREGGNNFSFHVILLLAATGLGIGTLVPVVFVPTHPRGEEVGRIDLVFIGVPEGVSDGTKEEGVVKRGEDVGRGPGGSE